MNPKAMYLELHVPDFELAKDFYGKLGFSVVWERKPEADKGYLVLKKGEDILCFWPGNQEVYNQPHFKKYAKDAPRGVGVEIAMAVEDIEAFYEQVRTFATITEPLETKPWGLKDFRIVDPFGYYFRFSEPHDITNMEYAVE